MFDFIIGLAVAAALTGYVNFAYLIIINNKLNEIKTEISRLKKEKGGEQ